MIASPCINVCKMDEQTGLCSGCFRTIDEIAVWAGIDDARRLGGGANLPLDRSGYCRTE